jgi:hypothetical protein
VLERLEEELALLVEVDCWCLTRLLFRSANILKEMVDIGQRNSEGCNLDCVCMKHGKRDICKVTRHEQHFGVWKGLSGTFLGALHWVLLSPGAWRSGGRSEWT